MSISNAASPVSRALGVADDGSVGSLQVGGQRRGSSSVSPSRDGAVADSLASVEGDRLHSAVGGHSSAPAESSNVIGVGAWARAI